MHKTPIPYSLLIVLLACATISVVAQTPLPSLQNERFISGEVTAAYARAASQEDCSNGVDDDGDGLVDCADSDCIVLDNGGFEDVPTNESPNSYVTFPQYPVFLGSWAAVNIDGEVFYESASRPAQEGHRYASLLQNAGANPRTPWNETSWQAGGYDRFLFIAETYPEEDYTVNFHHAGDSRYNYFGDRTLVQIQSLDTDFYYDTLLTTPGVFDWTAAEVSFQTDSETQAVAILFSPYGSWHASVLIDGLTLCGPRVPDMVAVNDTILTETGGPADIEVLANDIHIPPSGVALSVLASAEPLHGDVLVNLNGTLTYTPDPGYTGTDRFTYRICRSAGVSQQCSEAEVILDIHESLGPGTDTFFLTIEEEGVAMICSGYFEVGSASMTVCRDGTLGSCLPAGAECMQYQGDLNASGTDTLCLVSCDGAECDTSLFIIDITPVNDPPAALGDAATVQENGIVVIPVLLNDSDPDHVLYSHNVTVIVDPRFGTAAAVDGGLQYVPDPGFYGTDTLIYLVCDDGVPVLCDTASVVLTVYPVAEWLELTVWEDSVSVICPEGNGLLAAADGSVQVGGAVQLTADCVEYRPPGDYYGGDTLYAAFCAGAFCDTIYYLIDVLPVNDAPVAADDYFTGTQGTVLTLGVALNDGDPRDGTGMDLSSVVITRWPRNGKIYVLPDGRVEYTPDEGWSGTDDFAYRICDNGTPAPALCDSADVFVDVSADETRACFIPESFSPNGDGLYDAFAIECADRFPDLVLEIYDRYGNRMYHSGPGYANDWTGISDRDRPLREGTYYWLVNFNDGHTKNRSGFVLLWR